MTDPTDLLNGLLPFPVSFTTLALVVFGLFVAIALVRGVLRLIFGMLALAIGCLAAYFVYLRAPEFFTSPRSILVVSITAGFLAYLSARFLILTVLLRPFLGKAQGTGPVGALISLIPAAFLVWVLATGFRLTGTVMEMEQFGDNVTADEGQEINEGWLAHWRRALDNDRLARLLAKVDPFVEQGKAALVSFLISSRDVSAPDEIAASDKDAAAVINSTTWRELQSDPEIRTLIEEGQYISLLQNPKVRAATRESHLAERLKSIDIAASLENALYSEESKGEPKTRKRIPSRLWRNSE